MFVSARFDSFFTIKIHVQEYRRISYYLTSSSSPQIFYAIKKHSLTRYKNKAQLIYVKIRLSSVAKSPGPWSINSHQVVVYWTLSLKLQDENSLNTHWAVINHIIIFFYSILHRLLKSLTTLYDFYDLLHEVLILY